MGTWFERKRALHQGGAQCGKGAGMSKDRYGWMCCGNKKRQFKDRTNMSKQTSVIASQRPFPRLGRAAANMTMTALHSRRAFLST